MKRTHAALTGLLLTTLTLGGFAYQTTYGPSALAAPTETTNTTTDTQLDNPSVPLPASARFASDINAYQEADKKQMPPSGAVLFLGSSSIRFWTTVAQDFPELPVINRGFGGSYISDSVDYANRIAIPYKPKLIVFYAGTNDIADGKSPEQTLKDFQAFVAKVHTALPETRIAYISINPSISRWSKEERILKANSLIKQYIEATPATTAKLSYLDSHARLLGPDGQSQASLLRPDELHLNAEGYKAWVAILRSQILELADKEGVQRLEKPAR